MALKPMVDGLEEQFAGRARVLRINVRERDSRLARALELKMTPTFILLDPQGRVIDRVVGRGPNKKKILEMVRDQPAS